MRKEFKAIIAAVLAVWLFLMGFEIGSYHEKQEIRKQQTELTAPAPLTDPTQPAPPLASEAAPTEPEPSITEITGVGNAIAEITTYPDSELTADTKKTTTAATETKAPDTTQAASSLSKKQILRRVTEAVNNLKNTKDMTARNQETISIRIVDCSAKSAVNLLNSIISKKVGSKNVTYVFTNGKAVGHDDSGKAIKDEGEVSPTQVIPPTDASFTLPEAGIAAASAAQNGAFVSYTLKLKEESSSLERPVPTYNSQAIGYLKMTDMQVPGATITGADMHYPGSTVTVTVDTQGRVRQLQLYLPMDGKGSAKMGLLSGSASFEGYSTQNWTFTY